MCEVTEQLKKIIWEKGIIVEKYDSDKIRKDACGAWIQYDKYGDRNSIFGWEIDHVYPQSILRDKGVSKEDIDNMLNMRPLNWINNESKGSDYPVYHANVVSNDDTNKRGDYEFEVNQELQKKLQEKYGKYL